MLSGGEAQSPESTEFFSSAEPKRKKCAESSRAKLLFMIMFPWIASLSSIWSDELQVHGLPEFCEDPPIPDELKQTESCVSFSLNTFVDMKIMNHFLPRFVLFLFKVGK